MQQLLGRFGAIAFAIFCAISVFSFAMAIGVHFFLFSIQFHSYGAEYNDWLETFETSSTAELFLLFFQVFILAAALPAMIVAAIAEWKSLRSILFYVTVSIVIFFGMGVLFKGAGFLGLTSAVLAGMTYWLFAGRHAGLWKQPVA